MKIKKIFILITFVAISLFAGNTFACDMYSVSNCGHTTQPITNQISYPVLPPYQPTLPQTYGGENTVVALNNGAPTNTLVTSNTTISTPVAKPYVPVSPIIYNGNGTYTEQNTGTTYGTVTKPTTSTNTTNNGTATSGTDSESILGNIFGTKKTTTFSNGINNPTNTENSNNSNTNLQALVNSRGLAMGSGTQACGVDSNNQYAIYYKNITGQSLSNTAIRISLPTGVTPIDMNSGSYSERDNTVTFFLGTLQIDQQGQIMISTKTTGTVSGVARSEFVYTLPNQVQDMIVSYAFGNTNCTNTNNALGASAIGSGSNFFSGTLLGWLFLALLVSAFIYLVRFFLMRPSPHGDGHSHSH